jgi:hypothetical protein
MKPILVSIEHTPLVLQNVDAIGANMRGLDSSWPLTETADKQFIVDLAQASWEDVQLDLNLSWPRLASDEPALSFLRIPDQLPFVITGSMGKERLPLPQVSLYAEGPLARGLVAGMVEGKTWPEQNGAVPVLGAGLVYPDSELMQVTPSPALAVRHSFSFTRQAVATSDPEQRQVFTDTVSLYYDLLQYAYGIPITARLLAAAPREQTELDPLPGSAVLSFDPVASRDDAFAAMGLLLLSVAQTWWGGGIRVIGWRSGLLVKGVAFSSALRVMKRLGIQYSRDAWIASALLRSIDSTELLTVTTLGHSIAESMEVREELKREFAEFTVACWRHSVPEAELIRWLLAHQIFVPSELTSGE